MPPIVRRSAILLSPMNGCLTQELQKVSTVSHGAPMRDDRLNHSSEAIPR
jgi:hypothetical protein